MDMKISIEQLIKCVEEASVRCESCNACIYKLENPCLSPRFNMNLFISALKKLEERTEPTEEQKKEMADCSRPFLASH